MSLQTQFDHEYSTMLATPSNSDEKIYNIGMQYLLETEDVSIQEDILTKLMYFNPNRVELYYYMGCIQKKTNFYKALMWFQLCFQKDPLYIENTLDLMKLLFDTNNIPCLSHLLNSKWEIIKDINDPRFLNIVGVILIINKNIEFAYQFFNHMMPTLENLDNSDSQSIVIYYIYLNYAYICAFLSDIKKSTFYLQKIINNENNLCTMDTKPLLIAAYQNYILNLDYTYMENQMRFEISRKINTLYDVSNDYRWDIPQEPEKIRIGYVSNSMFAHAVSNFIIPILQNHTKLFEVFIITEQVNKISNYIDHIHGIKIIDIIGKSAKECADIINQEKIDILIDLDGYTAYNRLDIFAKNPAPIQITYLGYPNSLGLDFISYRIVDHITDPADSTQLYSEHRLYMPRCFLLYKSLLQENQLPFNQRKFGMEHCIILGSLNKEIKISSEVLQTWKQILQRTVNTKLLIKLDGRDHVDERTEYYKEQLGVDSDRLIIQGYCDSSVEYIELFYKTDILLDTFPYSGTTTTCNALYNSTPVITYYNKDYHAHCVSASILKNCGYGELVAYSEEEYIQKVVDLCGNYEKIQQYRETIGGAFAESMRADHFIPEYEAILRELYNKHACKS